MVDKLLFSPKNGLKGAFSLFFGEYPHGLDVKNRVIIPTRFREGLGDTFMITRSLDNCLVLYPMDEWNALNEKILRLPRSEEIVRLYIRKVIGGAAVCEPDSTGRALIPQYLREYAGINKDVISVGMLNTVEIWAKEEWHTERSRDIKKDAAAVIREYGL